MNKGMLIKVGATAVKEASDVLACVGSGLKCGLYVGGAISGFTLGVKLIGKIQSGIADLFSDSDEEEEDEDN